MDIRKIIKEEIKKAYNYHIFENYPLGAKSDSDAPWNKDDSNIRKGEEANKIAFDVIWYSSGAGFAIVKDVKDRLYALNTDMIENEGLEPYADRNEEFDGFDEDGDPIVNYGEWEVDEHVIENYINDNLGKINVGKGIENWENGEYIAVEIDDEIKKDLAGAANYVKNTKNKQELLGILGGINEIAQKIVDTDTMDTPTGSLYTISMSENDTEIIDNSIVDYNNIKSKAKEESKEGYVVHVNVGEEMGNVFFKTSDWFDSSTTVASYDNGKVIHEENFENITEIIEWIEDHIDNYDD